MKTVSECFCFSLRTGTKIIAHIQIVYSIVALISNIIAIMTADSPNKTTAGILILLSILSIIACIFLVKGVKEVCFESKVDDNFDGFFPEYTRLLQFLDHTPCSQSRTHVHIHGHNFDIDIVLYSGTR